jgi:glucan 1,3-beta-glucosidase
MQNSGRRGTANWQNDDENVNRTKAALQTLLDDFYVPEYYDTVTSIELLNEPAGFLGGKMMDVVKQFYYDSYGQVRYPASADGNTTASDLLVT